MSDDAIQDQHVRWLAGTTPDEFFRWHIGKGHHELVQSLWACIEEIRRAAAPPEDRP